jgi:hypothetical protein
MSPQIDLPGLARFRRGDGAAPNVHLARLDHLEGRPYELSTDAWERQPSFGFDYLADAIAKIILQSAPQLTLAVYGNWGMGKTTLLHAVADRVRGRCAVAWFDMWEYKNQQNVIAYLLDAIAAALPKRSELAKAMRTLGRGALASASLNAGSVRFSGKDLLGELDQLWDAPRLETETLAAYVERWRSAGGDGQEARRIVVIVDNLDRCLGEHAVALLEQITTLFGFEGVVFVLAAEKDRLVDAVAVKYNLASEEASVYLEKIVQVEFQVPGLDEDHVLTWIRTLAAAPFDLDEDEMRLLAETAAWNPRQIKRLLNNVRIQLCTSRHSVADDKGVVLASTLLFHRDRDLWLELTKDSAKRQAVDEALGPAS